MGDVLPERCAGVIYVKGPGVMTGYYGDPITTKEVLSSDGWLNTGDIGYRIGKSLVINGREKDLIIINGKNIWPQDLEYLAECLPGVRPGDVVLTLDPGMAFGTGLHPTTQMCLQALEELVQPGNTLLDVGTGSGILAIAAVKMGAKPILAFDTDELAVKTTIANAEQNQVDAQIETRQATLDKVDEKPWHIVVVNILAPVIISLFDNDDLMSYVAENGRLILSGIIEPQMGDVETAVSRAGGKIVKTYQIRDWVSYVVSHV